MKPFNPKNLNKSSLSKKAASIIKKVDDGVDNPLEVYIQCKAHISVMNEVMKMIEQQAKEEASKYSKNDSTLFGVSFSLVSGSVMPRFKEDAHYVKINDELSKRKELLKQALKMHLNKDLGEDSALIIDSEQIPVVGYDMKKGSLNITFPK